MKKKIMIVTLAALLMVGCSTKDKDQTPKEDPDQKQQSEENQEEETKEQEAEQAKEEETPSVVATVNGEKISGDYFDKNFELIAYQYRKASGDDVFERNPDVDLKNVLKNNLVQNLVDDIIISQYAKDNEISVEDKEINEVYDNFIKNVQENEEFNNFLKDKKLDEKFLKKSMESQLLIAHTLAHLKNELLNNDQATAELEKEVVEVKASHILVKGYDEAQELYEKLKEDPSQFAELATEHSLDLSNKDAGGDLGYFSYETMIPEFSQAAFGAEVGQVTRPVETVHGYHLILVSDKRSLEDMKKDESVDITAVEKLRDKLLERESQRLLFEKVEAAREKAEITTHEFGAKR